MPAHLDIYLTLLVLLLLLVASAWFDFKFHRIPNAIVYCGMALGMALNGLLPPGGGFINTHYLGAGGFKFALVGLGLGLACLLPPYLLRVMGAGDVKLMAMVGAFLGPVHILGAVLFTFLAGGAMALAVVTRERAWGLLGQNLRVMLFGGAINASAGKLPVMDAPAQSVGQLPYGIAIAVGTVAWVAWRFMS